MSNPTPNQTHNGRIQQFILSIGGVPILQQLYNTHGNFSVICDYFKIHYNFYCTPQSIRNYCKSHELDTTTFKTRLRPGRKPKIKPDRPKRINVFSSTRWNKPYIPKYRQHLTIITREPVDIDILKKKFKVEVKKKKFRVKANIKYNPNTPLPDPDHYTKVISIARRKNQADRNTNPDNLLGVAMGKVSKFHIDKYENLVINLANRMERVL